MINNFYTSEIAGAIKELFDKQTNIDQAKNILVGDLSMLPSPEEIGEYMPIVFITPKELDAEIANENWNISRVLYPYSILYISTYNFKLDDEIMRKKIKEGELFANILTNNPNVANFNVAQSDTEAGGKIIQTKVSKVRFDSVATQIFSQLKVPACIVEMDFLVMFTTYQRYA